MSHLFSTTSKKLFFLDVSLQVYSDSMLQFYRSFEDIVSIVDIRKAKLIFVRKILQRNSTLLTTKYAKTSGAPFAFAMSFSKASNGEAGRMLYRWGLGDREVGGRVFVVAVVAAAVVVVVLWPWQDKAFIIGIISKS